MEWHYTIDKEYFIVNNNKNTTFAPNYLESKRMKGGKIRIVNVCLSFRLEFFY